MELHRFSWENKAHRLLLNGLYELSSTLPKVWLERLIKDDPGFICLFSLGKDWSVENLCLASVEGVGEDYSIIIHHLVLSPKGKRSDFRESCMEYFQSISTQFPQVKRVIYQTSFGDLKTFTKSLGFKLERIVLVKELKRLESVSSVD